MYYSFAFVTTNLRPAVYLQIRLQSPRVRIHILKFSREKNSCHAVCRAMLVSLLHLVYFFYPNRQVRFALSFAV